MSLEKRPWSIISQISSILLRVIIGVCGLSIFLFVSNAWKDVLPSRSLQNVILYYLVASGVFPAIAVAITAVSAFGSKLIPAAGLSVSTIFAAYLTDLFAAHAGDMWLPIGACVQLALLVLLCWLCWRSASKRQPIR